MWRRLGRRSKPPPVVRRRPLLARSRLNGVSYADSDTLVSPYRLLLRWGFPRKRDPTSGERHFGQPVPEPVRITTRRGPVIFDGQRLVGNVQFGCGLRTGGPSWPVRSAADEACRCPGARRIGHGTHARTGIWQVSWRHPLTARRRRLLRSLIAATVGAVVLLFLLQKFGRRA